MICPNCRVQNSDSALNCRQCGTALVTSDGELAAPDSHRASDRHGGGLSPSSMPTMTSASAAQLQIAVSDSSAKTADFGPRYRVEGVLGEGGMGTVYKAWDKELDRTVALKLVRRDLTLNPGASMRFKQELLLASKISHRNILRIHDLGDAPDGTKFISMAYIEGQDLYQVIGKQGRLPLERALKIARQLCEALDAAHREGVVHRDLKPQNILVDNNDQIYVSDFGLAKSLESDLGMTRTGQFLGTPRYMSPEQAEAKPVDHRTDLYSFGLILCELATGDIPFAPVRSTLQMMFQRVQENAKDPKQLNPDLPDYVAHIIQKCLERDVAERYESAREILADLDANRAPALTHHPRTLQITVPGRKKAILIAAGTCLVLLLASLAVPRLRQLILRSGPPAADLTAPAGPVTSLAIIPLRNVSGDPSLDWLGPSLAEMLTTDVGQSSQLRTASPDRLHQIFNDLKISPRSALDPATIRRLAEFSNADRVVWGQYVKFGDQIRIDATLEDVKHDRSVPLKTEAASQNDLLRSVDRLAQSIRENLALSPQLVKELQAQSFKPTSQSLDAIRFYNEGLELARQGNSLEALKRFQSSVKEDPKFALAYAKLGQTYSTLGYDNEAEQASRHAVELSSGLPERERYLIIASHARVINDKAKAIEYYEDLARVSPEDQDVQFTLGGLYETATAFAKAREHYSKVLQRDPQSMDALLAMGRVENKSGSPQRGLEYFNRALSIAIQVGNDEERAASLQAIGVTYRILNKPEDALRNYQESLAIKRRIGQKRGIAISLNEIGKMQGLLGKPREALAAFQEALQIRRDIGDKRGLGDTLIDLGNFYNDRGNHDQALKLYKESLQIQRELGNQGLQAICLNNVGSQYFSKGQYEDALTYFQQALQLREKANVPEDIVESVHNVAETDARIGQYEQAISHYMRALELRRNMHDARGAAIESYSMGTLFDYQGRLGAAVSSKQEALKAFTDLKDKTFWMAEILGGYGEALILAGRGDEAKNYLEEALRLSRELKNEGLMAQSLDFLGDASYYRGDYKSARSFYERALQTATHTTEPDKVVIAKVELARVKLREGHAQMAAADLRPLVQQAEDLGLKSMAIECSIDLADAMLEARDYTRAQQELDRALLRADKLGLQPLSIRARYLLATIMRQSGRAVEAQDQYREVVRMLDAVAKEPGAEKVLQRFDLNAMYKEASRWSQATTN